MSERVLIVGDLHGDWGRFNKLIQKKRPDIVLQCGDFGWWPRFEQRKAVLYKQKPWLCKGGVKPGSSLVYWCDGNHEDHEDLESYGRRQKDEILVYPRVIYKPRGTVLKLEDGRVVLFCGGAESIDKNLRTPGFDWFYQEVPNEHEYDRMLAHDHVDIVISHTCPRAWDPDSTRVRKQKDPTRMMLDRVLDKYKPSLWYHGHWHRGNKGVSGDTQWFSLDYPGHGGRWWTWLI